MLIRLFNTKRVRRITDVSQTRKGETDDKVTARKIYYSHSVNRRYAGLLLTDESPEVSDELREIGVKAEEEQEEGEDHLSLT